jgi:hypothetical protein
MSNNIQIGGLAGAALSSPPPDGSWPTANLPWWVTGELASFARSEPMTICPSLDSDFLCVSPTPFIDRSDARKSLFDKVIGAVSRVTSLPQRIKVASA